MKSNPRIALLPLAISLMLISVSACSKTENKDAPAAAGTAAAAGTGAPAIKVPGLETERAQVSYMVGMDIAKSLDQIKADIDVDTMANGIRDSFAKKGVKLTDEQANQVRQAFTQQLQQRAAAKQAEDAKKNLAEGEAFLAGNKGKPDVRTTASGLQYQILRAGSGPKPAMTDTVKVNYKGTFLNGETFDSSYDRGQPVDFALNQVVPGWGEGVALMPVGSKFKFWLPASLAYGENGSPPTIGPNATLVFEVELIEIVK